MGRSIRMIVGVVVLLALLPGCEKQPETVKIGFVGALSGRSSGIGQEGRDAFLLAVEQVNRQGGVHGRPVEVLVLDHGSEEGGAVQALRDMKDAGVQGVVGPMLSQIAIPMAAEADRLELPLVGPTVSTEELSHRDDFFFRPHYSDGQAASILAGHLRAEQRTRVAIFFDLDNRAYSESWRSAFSSHFPGQTVDIPFTSSAAPVFSRLVSALRAQPPDAVLIIANAPDTAMICQQLELQGLKVAKYATCWSASGPLNRYGGHSVDGLEFLHSINLSSSAPAYRLFLDDFQARFSRAPLFPALHAYDATRLLLHAAELRKANESLAASLRGIRKFQGVQYLLNFDDTGDLENPPLFLTRVVDSQFCFVCTM